MAICFARGVRKPWFSPGPAPNVSVAELMAEAAQLPASAALIEPAARSTLQNALFSLALLPEDARIILVSDGYHLPRSWVSFKLMGVRSVELAPAGGQDSVEVWEILREGAAIWFNLLRGGAYWLTGLLAPEAEWRVHLLI